MSITNIEKGDTISILHRHGRIKREIISKEDNIPSAVVVESDGVQILEVAINGNCYGFNIDWVPEDQIEWLGSIVARHLYEVHVRAVKSTKKEMSDRFNNIMNWIGD